MIINDLDGYYIVFDTKNWNTELDTLVNKSSYKIENFSNLMAKVTEKAEKDFAGCNKYFVRNTK